MNILLHICCAPCAIYPLGELRRQGMAVTGFFYNHNIHPYTEYKLRRDAVKEYAGLVQLEVVYRDEYRLEEFLENVAAEPSAPLSRSRVMTRTAPLSSMVRRRMRSSRWTTFSRVARNSISRRE